MRRHTVGGQETIRSPGTKESKGIGLNDTSTSPKAHAAQNREGCRRPETNGVDRRRAQGSTGAEPQAHG